MHSKIAQNKLSYVSESKIETTWYFKQIWNIVHVNALFVIFLFFLEKCSRVSKKFQKRKRSKKALYPMYN